MNTKFYLMISLFLIAFTNAQEKTNPLNICKTCGSFDLSKLTFNENISDLTAKTEVWKSALVNKENELKDEEDLLKSDKINLIIYHFANGRNKNLGNAPFNYQGQFNFDALNILTSPDNQIYALSATVFHEGTLLDIDKFTEYLKKDNKNFKFEKNSMYGDLSVYQWFSKDKIIQLVRDNKLGKEENSINGKKTVRNSTYVKLVIYDQVFISKHLKNFVERNMDFVLFDQQHFIKK